MSMIAKFDGKCKFCGVKITKGDSIHNFPGQAHWCISETCARGTTTTPTPTPTPAAAAPNTSSKVTMSTKPYQLIHDEIWEFALGKASDIYPVDSDRTSRMILAQVFYKKTFDYHIHV